MLNYLRYPYAEWHWGVARMMRTLSRSLAGLVLIIGLMAAVPALAGLDPAFSEPARGPGQAKGVVIWSHGRSINAEDSQSPSPTYLRALLDSGWDVMRFNRLSQGDTLSGIAAREYGDPNAWRAVADHNAARLPSVRRLPAGIVLDLPPLDGGRAT